MEREREKKKKEEEEEAERKDWECGFSNDPILDDPFLQSKSKISRLRISRSMLGCRFEIGCVFHISMNPTISELLIGEERVR